MHELCRGAYREFETEISSCWESPVGHCFDGTCCIYIIQLLFGPWVKSWSRGRTGDWAGSLHIEWMLKWDRYKMCKYVSNDSGEDCLSQWESWEAVSVWWLRRFTREDCRAVSAARAPMVSMTHAPESRTLKLKSADGSWLRAKLPCGQCDCFLADATRWLT